MCYKRHFVAIIEFDFFVEQHLLCTQLEMGLLMSRGEHWREGYMFATPESMPLWALDWKAQGGWGTFSKFRVLFTVSENSIYLFIFSYIQPLLNSKEYFNNLSLEPFVPLASDSDIDVSEW